MHSILAYIQRIKDQENLTSDEIKKVMHSIMSGYAQNEETAEFLLALNEKGPTVEEIVAAAKIMRQFSVQIPCRHKVILDTCGTGGDSKHSFNISTVTALVVASAGVVVAKHGNRSVSSKVGSVDVLEALGVKVDIEEAHLTRCLDEVGIGFLFAQKLHPAMRNVAQVRKELGVKTIFNVLGPLTNPANATHQMVGVYSRDLVEPIAHVLKDLGLKRAIVVHGSNGLDEITTTGSTFIGEFDGQKVVSYDVDPTELGIKIAKDSDLKGDDLKTNVKIIREILQGKKGPHRDIVVLNSAYALYAAEKVKNVSQGLELATQAIDSRNAWTKLDELIAFTNQKF